MSWKSPRLIAPMVAVALAAATITSCSQQIPTAPSALGGSIATQPAAEYWVTLYDETPPPGEPAPPLDEPPPPDEPAPPPGEPAPAPPPRPPAPPPASGSPPSPWPPGPPPKAQPGVPEPTPPSRHPRLHIVIEPEPVGHDGKPVGTYSCRDHKYTWYYRQRLISDTGVVVTLTERENFFDGRFTSKNGETIQLPGNREVVINTRWCSSYKKPHYTQTRYKGRDEYNEPVVISGPWVRLLTP